MQAPIDWMQLAAILMLLVYAMRIDSALRDYRYEHELLIADYCERKNIKLESLPTRIRRRR